MSHQSGIRASPELLSAFSDAVHNNNQRAFKVVIADEILQLAETMPVRGTWEEDFPSITEWMQPTEPCFVLYRLDQNASTTTGADWIMLQFVPENAKVREKMLLASSKATLLKELGDSKFVDTLYGTERSDLSLEGYRKHLIHKEADAPLTERELEMQNMKIAESTADIGSSSRVAHTRRIDCPLTDEATAALEQLKSGSLKAVALSIDLEKETVGLGATGSSGFSDLPTIVKPTVPSFAFFKLDEKLLIFAYVCPPSSKVKERMIYSSFRNTLIVSVEKDMQMPISRKLEVDSIDELNASDLTAELQSVGTPELAKKSFARPARPGRGPARVSRPATPNSPPL
ncbi:Twinfilin-1 [Geranomyces michiganensis]|nr:Twinfilin-1 [Geranomyces michiganensis]